MYLAPRARAVLVVAAQASAYAAAVVLGRMTRLPGSDYALVWPAAAIGLLWLMQLRSRRGLALVSALVLGIGLAANLLTGMAGAIATSLAVVSLVSVLLPALLLRGHPERMRLLDLRDLLRLLRAICLGAAASAVLGGLTLAVLDHESFARAALLLGARTGVSMMLGVPVALRLRHALLGPRTPRPSRARVAEAVAVAVTGVAVFLLVFEATPGTGLAFVTVPLCVYVGIRFSTTFSTAYVLVCGSWIVASTLAGRGADGSLVVQAATAQLLVAVIAGVVFALALYRDERARLVEDLDVARTEAQEQADLFAAVLDAASEQAIIGTDVTGRVDVFNVGAQRMLGCPAEDVLGGTVTRLLCPQEIAARAAELGIEPGFEVLARLPLVEGSETRPWTFVHHDGSAREVELSVTPRRDSRGRLTGYIGVGADLTERNRVQRGLVASEERFRLAFDAAPVAMLLARRTPGEPDTIVQVNGEVCRFTGYTAEELVGLSTDTLLVDGMASFATVPEGTADPDSDARQECAFWHRSGLIIWGALSCAVLPDGQAVYLIEDVTARRDAEAELRRLALHDHLTGLSSRPVFEERLRMALLEARRTGLAVGVVYLDLDGFKAVNDGWGHTEGDELLRAVSRRILGTVRAGDTVSRLGGDEFAVVSPSLAYPEQAELLADRILAGFDQPFLLPSGSTHATVSASIGVTVVEPHTELSAEEVLSAAGHAMNLAKRSGKNRVQVNDAPSRHELLQESRLLPELGSAVKDGQLFLMGQQVVDMRTGEPAAVEMLIRWLHPRRGVLSPGAFLDLAETTPHIHEIGRFALDEACLIAAQQMPGHVPVHVNVSGRQFETGTLTTDVLGALERSGLEPSRLVLELTETLAGSIGPEVRADLKMLHDQGIQLAIDDIGTGYSSLARLTELPFDILKIDKAFVSGIGTSLQCEAVLRAVVQLGASLGVQVITEGIETEEQRDVLLDWGVFFGQGFLFDRPSPFEWRAA